ncbi:MAG: pantetheine-phosphate adenylyltransferase [bacterium]
MNTAVFPGSFDPITRGHVSVIHRALSLFDRIIIAIGENQEKSSYFPLETRLKWLHKVFEKEPRITVEQFSGLTVDYCRRVGAKFILRGLRTSADFEFERGIGQMNKAMVPEVETVFFLCSPEYAALSSSIVRDIHRHGGDIRQFIPEEMNL